MANDATTRTCNTNGHAATCRRVLNDKTKTRGVYSERERERVDCKQINKTHRPPSFRASCVRKLTLVTRTSAFVARGLRWSADPSIVGFRRQPILRMQQQKGYHQSHGQCLGERGGCVLFLLVHRCAATTFTYFQRRVVYASYLIISQGCKRRMVIYNVCTRSLS